MAKRKKNREESHVDGAVMDSQEARRVARVLVDEQSSQLSDVAVKAVVVATAVAAAIAADERTQQDTGRCSSENSRVAFPENEVR